MAGDVYARPPHAGRGGWSWYTGSAGWMYRAGVESILGLRRRGATFVIDPCIPSSWPEYRIAWRFLDSRYEITVSNPDAAVPRSDARPRSTARRSMRQRSRSSTTAGPTMCRSFWEIRCSASLTLSDWLELANADERKTGAEFSLQV